MAPQEMGQSLSPSCFVKIDLMDSATDNHAPVPTCFRSDEAKALMKSGREEYRSFFLELELYDDQWALAMGLKAPVSKSTLKWDWEDDDGRHKLQTASPGEIATHLHLESSQKLIHCFDFQAVLCNAFGLTMRTRSLELQYNNLSESLYNQLVRDPSLIVRLSQAQKELEITSDPFLCSAVANACACLEEGSYSEFKPDLDMFTRGLQSVLNGSGSLQIILEELKILRFRFQKYHQLDGKWEPFDVSNDLLKEIRSKETSACAADLTRIDILLFQEICDQDLIQKTEQSHALKRRSESLSTLAGECMVSGPRIRSQIYHLVKELIKIRNFYSATAIMTGMSNAGYSVRAFNHHACLINSHDNYRSYRHFMDSQGAVPALYSIFPYQNESIASHVLSASASYAKKYHPYILKKSTRTALRASNENFNFRRHRMNYSSNNEGATYSKPSWNFRILSDLKSFVLCNQA